MKKILIALLIGVFCFGQNTVKVPEDKGVEIFNKFSTKILKDFMDMKHEIEKLKDKLNTIEYGNKPDNTTIQIDPVILEYIKE